MRIVSTLFIVLALATGALAQGPDLSKLRPTDDMIPVARFQNVDLRDALHLIAETHGLRVEFAPGRGRPSAAPQLYAHER